jgi:hypothetical protein
MLIFKPIAEAAKSTPVRSANQNTPNKNGEKNFEKSASQKHRNNVKRTTA